MRLVGPLAIAALLAGCSLFSDTTSWTKPGVAPEQMQADVAACKRIATAQQKTESNIDQDRSAVMNDSAYGAVDTELSQGMARQRTGKRFNQLVDDCMRQLGYSPAD